MDPIANYIGWLKRRVTLNDTEIWYVKFIMDQYAKDYHDSEVKKLNLPDVSNCPAWLLQDDLEYAKMLYKKRKIDGVKYLYKLAKPFEKSPISWAKDFLDGCC